MDVYVKFNIRTIFSNQAIYVVPLKSEREIRLWD